MASVTPFLWFDGRVGEAATFYTSVFGDSAIIDLSPGPDGEAMMARFRLAGQELIAFNGGPMFKFSPAISLFVSVETQGELDRYWNALLAGGEASQCGWLVDKFGLSWQIIPTMLGALLGSADRIRADRAMQAMLGMRKIDIAELQTAYDA
jgi:predicted 3-demethylubiquinone-9 3-methyltransferase (glyoxalase superfamily)